MTKKKTKTEKAPKPAAAVSGTVKKSGGQKADAAKAETKGPVMYVGPDDPDIGIQNTVFSEMPELNEAVRREVPEVVNLFIPIGSYPMACRQLRDGKGYIFSAFNKVSNRR